MEKTATTYCPYCFKTVDVDICLQNHTRKTHNNTHLFMYGVDCVLRIYVLLFLVSA